MPDAVPDAEVKIGEKANLKQLQREGLMVQMEDA